MKETTALPRRTRTQEDTMKTRFYTTQELIDDPGNAPFDLEVIPNYIGINLVSVEGMSWTKQDDGQFVSLTIHFIPAVEREQ